MRDDLTLPPETMDQIIDALALQDDRYLTSVKASSLACRAFLPWCRKHIFASITLHQPWNSQAYTGTSLSALLKVSPELAHYIRKVIYAFRRQDEAGDISILHTLFARLTRVQSLTLISYANDPTWNTPCRRPVLLPLLHSSTLTHLKLSDIRGFILCDLTPCVNLRELDIIIILGSFDPPTVELPSILPTKPITLDRFSFSTRETRFLQEICTARRPDGKNILELSNLKKISLDFAPAGGLRLPFMMELFGRQQCLADVELTFQMLSNRLGGLFDILSNGLGSLKRLSLTLYISEYSEGDTTDPIPVLCHELDQMNGRNIIEKLEIKICIYIHIMSPFTRADDWGTLDGTLMHGGWPALNLVSFLVGYTNPRSCVDEQFAKTKDLAATHFTRLMSSPTVQFEYEAFEDC